MKHGIGGRLRRALVLSAALGGFAASAQAATYIKCAPQDNPANITINLTIDFGANTLTGVVGNSPLTDAYGRTVLGIQATPSEVKWAHVELATNSLFHGRSTYFTLNRLTGLLQIAYPDPDNRIYVYQCAVSDNPRPMF